MNRRALLLVAVSVLALGSAAVAPVGGQPAGPVDSTLQSATEFNVTSVDAPSSVVVGDSVTVNATIENEGDAFGTQDVVVSLEGAGGGSDSATVENVSLDIGQRETVQVTLNTTGFEPGNATAAVTTLDDSASRTVVIESAPAPYFAVQNVSAPRSVTAGTEFDASVTVENTGDEYGAQSLDITLTGSGGASGTISFTAGLDIGENSTYIVTLNTSGYETGIATLNASSDNETVTRNVSITTPGTANFTITDLTAPGSVTAGNTITANATIENTGDAFGTQDVQFGLFGPGPNNDTVTVEDVSLDIGQRETVQVTLNTTGFRTGTARLITSTANDSARRNVSIEERAGAFFEVVTVVAPSNVTAGSGVSVRAAIRNTGDAFGTQDVQFGLFGPGPNNDTVTVENVSLDIGERTVARVTLDTAGFRTGTATLTVGTANESRSQSVSLTAATNGSRYWSTEGYDERNSNYNPAATAPTAKQTVEWSFDVNTVGSRGASVGSSAAVVDGGVYFGDATSVSASSYVFRLNASTGDIVWKYAVGRFSGRDVYGTPTVANGTVYAADTNGRLYAVDAATGTEEYIIDVGDGTAASRATEPTVDNGTLYFGNHNGVLYAYDAATGQRKWSFDGDNSTGYPVTGAPVLTQDTLYFTTDSNLGYGRVYAVDRETGTERWNRTFTGNTCVGAFPQPTLYRGQLFVGDTCTSEVNALDADTGATLWNVSVTGDVVAEPAVDGERLYVTDTTNTLTAVDLSTRSIVWQQGLGGAGRSSPTVANGMVYVGDDSGQLQAFNASTGAQMFSELFDGAVASAPTPAAGAVYVGATDRMHKVSGSVESGIVTEIEPDTRIVDVEARKTVSLTASNTGDGVGAFNVTVELGRTELADIVDVTVAGNPASVNVVRGNGSITIAASGLNISDPTAEPMLAELTVAGRLPGETSLSMSVGSIQSPGGRTYDVIERRNATLTVRDDSGNWRMGRFNERNTGYSPTAASVAAFPQVDWKFDIKTDHESGGRKGGRTIARSAVTVVNGTAFVGDRAGFTSPGYLYAMNASTGAYRWRSSVTGFDPGMQTTPAVSNGRVFFGDDGGTLWALDVANGSVDWSVGQNQFYYSPTVVGDTLYATNGQGKLFAFDASDGSQKWVHESARSYPGTHSPVVYDGRVYYSTFVGTGEGQLYAIDPASGNEIWNRTFEDATSTLPFNTPTAGGGALYVSDTRAPRLNAIDADNGTTLWNVSVDAEILAPPAYAEGVVYVTDRSGALYAVDTDNRSVMWEAELGSTFQSGPTVANGVVYAGDTNGVLYGVDAETGNLVWTERVDGSIDAAPTPINGRVYVGGNNFVYAFAGPAEPWTVERSVAGANASVQPGDDIEVTVRATVTELPPEGDLDVAETVSGPVTNVTVGTVTVNGSAVTPKRSTANANGVNVTLDRATVRNAQTVAVTYSVSVLSNASRGGAVGLDGRLSFNGSEQRVGTTELRIEPASVTVPGRSSPAQNIDSDSGLEDVDGSGTADVFDAIALYNNRNAKVVQNNPQFFDFDGNGRVDVFDAIELYNEIA